MNKTSLTNGLRIWLLSFTIVAVILFFYCGIPLHILVFTGIGTFILTLLQYFLTMGNRPSS